MLLINMLIGRCHRFVSRLIPLKNVNKMVAFNSCRVDIGDTLLD
jgi:hypothetical protein